MKLLFSFISVFFLLHIHAQTTINMPEAEDKLEQLLQDLRNAKNNQEKSAKNKVFKQELERVLQYETAMTYPFSKLTTVGFIDSPDGAMRIVNWNIEQDDFSQKYNCFILHNDKRRKTYHVTELQKDPMAMPMAQPEEILASNQWYGALYYKIIPIKKGRRTLYTVLGWDYYGASSQVRLVDVIYFTGKTVKLGSPIFKIGKTTKKRLFYEHSKKTSMALLYESDRKRIMMDHLSPESPSLKNFRSFYVPDMSYDALLMEGSKWVLKEDVIGVNKGGDAQKQTVYVHNERTGKVEAKEIKTKWINPEDMDAPAGGSEHVAVTPETAAEEEAKKAEMTDPNEPKADKRDKRDPNNLSFYKDIKKKKKRRKRKNR